MKIGFKMARSKILVFQHVPYEPLGTLDPLLKEAGLRKSEIAPFKRCFLHQRDLFAQREYVIVPITRAIKPRKRHLECRIFPAAREPRGVVHDA